MPNRLLKEGIVDSEKINALSPEAEVFFYRLLVVADDYGRMDARPAILRARCFPLKEVTNVQIQKWSIELFASELAIEYEVGGQPYMQILNWDQRQRSHGKYPAPTDEQLTATCQQSAGSRQQSAADCGLGLGLGLGKGKGLGETGRGKRAEFDPLSLELPDGLSAERWEEWIAYRRKRKLTITEPTMRKQLSKLDEWMRKGHSADAIIEESITQGWQGIFEPKAQKPASGKQSARDNYAAEAAAARKKGEGNEHVIDGECTVIR